MTTSQASTSSLKNAHSNGVCELALLIIERSQGGLITRGAVPHVIAPPASRRGARPGSPIEEYWTIFITQLHSFPLATTNRWALDLSFCKNFTGARKFSPDARNPNPRPQP